MKILCLVSLIILTDAGSILANGGFDFYGPVEFIVEPSMKFVPGKDAKFDFGVGFRNELPDEPGIISLLKLPNPKTESTIPIEAPFDIDLKTLSGEEAKRWADAHRKNAGSGFVFPPPKHLIIGTVSAYNVSCWEQCYYSIEYSKQDEMDMLMPNFGARFLIRVEGCPLPGPAVSVHSQRSFVVHPPMFDGMLLRFSIASNDKLLDESRVRFSKLVLNEKDLLSPPKLEETKLQVETHVLPEELIPGWMFQNSQIMEMQSQMFPPAHVLTGVVLTPSLHPLTKMEEGIYVIQYEGEEAPLKMVSVFVDNDRMRPIPFVP